MSSAQPYNDHTTIDRMSDSDIDAYLSDIRERRMRPYQIYLETIAVRKLQQDANVQKALDNALRLMNKDIIALDKKLQAVEDRANKIRVLRLQLGVG
jgi:hypothetical protein